MIAYAGTTSGQLDESGSRAQLAYRKSPTGLNPLLAIRAGRAQNSAMDKRARPRPTRVVPDFRGLNFFAANAIERMAEIKPADPNPDAPPLSAYWWQHQELVVSTQDPEPGAEVYQWDSVRVTLAPPEAGVGASIRLTPPLTLDAAAVPTEQSSASG